MSAAPVRTKGHGSNPVKGSASGPTGVVGTGAVVNRCTPLQTSPSSLLFVPSGQVVPLHVTPSRLAPLRTALVSVAPLRLAPARSASFSLALLRTA